MPDSTFTLQDATCPLCDYRIVGTRIDMPDFGEGLASSSERMIAIFDCGSEWTSREPVARRAKDQLAPHFSITTPPSKWWESKDCPNV